jgi:uncharacterized integral membrane protein
MALLRFVVILAVAGFLVIFTLSNSTVPMSIVFLGVRSPTMPLSLWILGAIAFGIATTVVINILFGLARFTARRSERKTTRKTTQPAGVYTYAQQAPRASSSDEADDWFSEGKDDWIDEPRDRPRQEFEKRQEPTSESRSGSSYSYTYRKPVDPPEVVDADYKVIKPPTRNLDEEEL